MGSVGRGEHRGEIKESDIRLVVVVQSKLHFRQLESSLWKYMFQLLGCVRNKTLCVFFNKMYKMDIIVMFLLDSIKNIFPGILFMSLCLSFDVRVFVSVSFCVSLCSCLCVHVFVFVSLCSCLCVRAFVFIYLCSCLIPRVLMSVSQCPCLCVRVFLRVFVYVSLCPCHYSLF